MSQDLYEVLGVPRTASPDEVTFAWRALVRSLHPDTARGQDDVDRLVAVQRAYRVLRSPEARAEYDRTGLTDEDRLKEIREGVVTVILTLFNQCVDAVLSSGRDVDNIDFVRSMRDSLSKSISDTESNIDKLRAGIVSREKLRRRIVRNNEEENVFAESLTHQLMEMNKRMRSAENILDVHRHALEELDLYSSPVEMVQRIQAERHGWYQSSSTNTGGYTVVWTR